MKAGKSMNRPNKVDILLVAPPLLWGQEHRMDLKPPVNLLYLAAFLNSSDHRAGVLDAVSEKLSLDGIVGRIITLSPRFVGIPLYHASIETSSLLAHSLRELDPAIRLIGGGPALTIDPEGILPEIHLDIAVLGEGEATLAEIIAAEESDLTGIMGVAFESEGRIYKTGPRQAIENLDGLPFLDYSLVDMNSYFNYQSRLGIPQSIYLTTSRGCPQRCVFCATPLLWPGKIRRYSPGRIIEEMKYQQGIFPGKNTGFLDDSFFSDQAWLSHFLDLVAPLELRYNCIGRIDQLDSVSIEALADTGCAFIAFGVETGSDMRQRQIKKFVNLDKLRENVALLSKHGIFTKGFFMLGFPDETPQDMADTINLAQELRHRGMKSFTFFPLIVYPGTELSRRFSITDFQSGIYETCAEDIMSVSDQGERYVEMYSTVPQSDVNPYFDHHEIVRLVKYAYNRIYSGEPVSARELLSLRDLHENPGIG